MATTKKKTKKEQYKELMLRLVDKRKKKNSPLTEEEEEEFLGPMNNLWKKFNKKDLADIHEWIKNDLKYHIPGPGYKSGIKHLIECHCTLPQYRKRQNRVFHKFVVFSVIDEKGAVIPKFVQCNNCGIVHYVNEIGKSEFIPKDEFPSIMTIEDVKYSIPRDVREILDDHNSPLSIWEEVAFLYENKRWDSHVIISSDESDNKINSKLLRIIDETFVKVETVTNEATISRNND